MATFLRTAVRARNLLAVSRQSRRLVQPSLWISTSKKNKDGINATIEEIDTSREDELKRLEEHFADQDPNSDKNWMSFGHDEVDRDYDTFAHNMTLFTSVTLSVVLIFFFSYCPDHKLNDWSMREAHLELARREKLGLPLIDRNIVDPSNIVLPPEEELEGVRIRL
ncbi:NADH dehydrogenase [ubiquinone] 1 beta subcomplex subunit 11, mitochondrial-like [Mizuhopecten yessoensis]|uniref:NADH dehydrogenase [ubiquinone] 1 beta subcomplex subunit 11, mitochondrial n=1 Tax=Mizuhopecten yessoensis TaxID=6573 RepID=A0A210QSD5_MIZYE|nr:NADH dehydrogenase [ubiquinone] 1 beta subcomplex subunit 11, mitochondrial-like [Mizuhopecten yessoensis]OWF51642.1 NADH dehydrogenase [ubiquinone] 1 beta subcomplex subunit 11, mitochondrial [Mizuhopecten yessoensis]